MIDDYSPDELLTSCIHTSSQPTGVYQPFRAAMIIDSSPGKSHNRAAFMHYDGTGHIALNNYVTLKGLAKAGRHQSILIPATITFLCTATRGRADRGGQEMSGGPRG